MSCTGASRWDYPNAELLSDERLTRFRCLRGGVEIFQVLRFWASHKLSKIPFWGRTAYAFKLSFSQEALFIDVKELKERVVFMFNVMIKDKPSVTKICIPYRTQHGIDDYDKKKLALYLKVCLGINPEFYKNSDGTWLLHTELIGNDSDNPLMFPMKVHGNQFKEGVWEYLLWYNPINPLEIKAFSGKIE